MDEDSNHNSTTDDTECHSLHDDHSARQWLTDELRYSIVMMVLGHPQRLPSLTELDYYVDADRSAIRTELDALADREFLTTYEFTGDPCHAAAQRLAGQWMLRLPVLLDLERVSISRRSNLSRFCQFRRAAYRAQVGQ